MRRRWIGSAVIAFVAALLGCAGPSAASNVFGLWREPDMGALVELYRCDKALCGRLIDLPVSAPAQDLKNPVPALQSRPLVGLQVVEGFRRIDDGPWIGGGGDGREPGRIYLPLNGDTLGDAENTYAIRLDGPDTLTVGLHGCVMTCFLNSTWYRVTLGDRAGDIKAETDHVNHP